MCPSKTPKTAPIRWTDDEHDILVKATNEQIALEKEDPSQEVPWKKHWRRMSRKLYEHGYTRNWGACRAHWKRTVELQTAREELAGADWTAAEHDLLVRTTLDQIAREQVNPAEVIPWPDHWEQVSAMLEEKGYLRSGDACGAYWDLAGGISDGGPPGILDSSVPPADDDSDAKYEGEIAQGGHYDEDDTIVDMGQFADNPRTAPLKSSQFRFTTEQRVFLLNDFITNGANPDRHRKAELANRLGVRESTITNWFVHQRIRASKTHLEGEVVDQESPRNNSEETFSISNHPYSSTPKSSTKRKRHSSGAAQGLPDIEQLKTDSSYVSSPYTLNSELSVPQAKQAPPAIAESHGSGTQPIALISANNTELVGPSIRPTPALPTRDTNPNIPALNSEELSVIEVDMNGFVDKPFELTPAQAKEISLQASENVREEFSRGFRKAYERGFAARQEAWGVGEVERILTKRKEVRRIVARALEESNSDVFNPTKKPRLEPRPCFREVGHSKPSMSIEHSQSPPKVNANHIPGIVNGHPDKELLGSQDSESNQQSSTMQKSASESSPLATCPVELPTHRQIAKAVEPGVTPSSIESPRRSQCHLEPDPKPTSTEEFSNKKQSTETVGDMPTTCNTVVTPQPTLAQQAAGEVQRFQKELQDLEKQVAARKDFLGRVERDIGDAQPAIDMIANKKNGDIARLLQMIEDIKTQYNKDCEAIFKRKEQLKAKREDELETLQHDEREVAQKKSGIVLCQGLVDFYRGMDSGF